MAATTGAPQGWLGIAVAAAGPPRGRSISAWFHALGWGAPSRLHDADSVPAHSHLKFESELPSRHADRHGGRIIHIDYLRLRTTVLCRFITQHGINPCARRSGSALLSGATLEGPSGGPGWSCILVVPRKCVGTDSNITTGTPLCQACRVVYVAVNSPTCPSCEMAELAVSVVYKRPGEALVPSREAADAAFQFIGVVACRFGLRASFPIRTCAACGGLCPRRGADSGPACFAVEVCLAGIVLRTPVVEYSPIHQVSLLNLREGSMFTIQLFFIDFDLVILRVVKIYMQRGCVELSDCWHHHWT